MTVSSTVTRVTYTGDGQTIAFPTTFPFFGASEIEVIERNIATGAETVKTLTTHYTVLGGNGATGTVTSAGGAPSSSVQWIIRRKTARTQEIDYTPNDPFPAETHEQGLDRLKMNVQELGEENDRALKFPKTDSDTLSTTIPSSVARAGKFLTFDGNGVPTVSAGSADSLAVSPFMAALLDDTDAPTARATLGISSTGLDITGMAALTTPATNDELPIYDLSDLANRKITVLNLFKALNALTAESAPATNDELMLWDSSEGAINKMTFSTFLTVINSLTEDTTPDAANDFVVTYDASAGAAKKVKPSNLGIEALSDYQQFTGSGTWTKPAGAKWVFVEAWGAGGGGARDTQGSSGGGGGAYVSRLFRAVDLGATETVTIGSGGVGRTGSSGSGIAGGTTTFGSRVSAPGGGGGDSSGGTGGYGNFGPYYGGGRGGDGEAIVPGDNVGGISVFGGAGGGGYSGSARAGGSSQFGGSGGSGNGSNGLAPGGGGGGNITNSNGGSGARGECRVYSW